VHTEERPSVRVAILDLYQGAPNQGMRCIHEILALYANRQGLDLSIETFDVRSHLQVPDLSFDIYISSGGPGSPLDSEGSEWEHRYFQWLHQVERWNNAPAHLIKKKVFFICHSFQLACRFFKIGHVTKRKSTAFGVFPMHMLHEGALEPVLRGLEDPFYAVDSRDYQVVQPNHNKLREMGARILCIEKERPHVPLERAMMAIRFNEHMIGTQFHPEADAIGMSMYLQMEEKKQTVIENHGFEKWRSMIDHLEDPDKILWTYAHILPNFLDEAVEHSVPRPLFQ
jgi:GMP synthase-like glutamine amidotransferase